MTVIDLRSDTVTKPSPGMRAAMSAAEVGDDVFGEDPTVNRLEERVAALLGKEAALYVPSGTMSNQIAVKAHTQPGDELLCDLNCHIYNYEAGGPAVLSFVDFPVERARSRLVQCRIRLAAKPPVPLPLAGLLPSLARTPTMAGIQLHCPRCHAALRGPAVLAVGTSIRCNKCNTVFLYEDEEADPSPPSLGNTPTSRSGPSCRRRSAALNRPAGVMQPC